MSTAKEVDTERLLEDLKTVITDAEELLKLTAGQAGDKVEALRGRIGERLESAKGQLGTLEESLVARTREVAKKTDDYVHANPWQAISTAAGVALVVGLLIGRR